MTTETCFDADPELEKVIAACKKELRSPGLRHEERANLLAFLERQLTWTAYRDLITTLEKEQRKSNE